MGIDVHNKKSPVGFEKVDAALTKLEQKFDLENPTGVRLHAVAVGNELAKIAIESPADFKLADKRLSQILERLIGNEMGAVAGAVERTFHSVVGDAATENMILRANKESKKERGL